MAEQQIIGGLSCGDVLARLSDYLDDDLSAEERAAVEEHLRGCRWCEELGGAVSAVVGSLREHLGTAPTVDDDVARRLAERLAREE
ncbi:MAG: zf-HC2 domain-containing protein [Myxococcales bacterium]|nr:zf-HC2 domain-containing protein [Myxococcales bacterium]